jgi:hypothetical protein
MKIEIELSKAEVKALSYVTDDPLFFMSNMVHESARRAIDYVFEEELKKMIADPNVTEIPADKESVVLLCTEPTIAERAALTPFPFVDDSGTAG